MMRMKATVEVEFQTHGNVDDDVLEPSCSGCERNGEGYPR
jgi:hypothetical protein